MSGEFVTKTFRERPHRETPEIIRNGVGQPIGKVMPPRTEEVGRLYAPALMGPTNITGNIVLQLWSDGTVTWRDA